MSINSGEYRVTMPDGSVWAVPLMVIARHRAKHYASEYGGDVEESLSDDTLPLFAADKYEVHDWAANNMNWSDVADCARMVRSRAPLTLAEMQEAWVNGKHEVVRS